MAARFGLGLVDGLGAGGMEEAGLRVFSTSAFLARVERAEASRCGLGVDAWPGPD